MLQRERERERARERVIKFGVLRPITGPLRLYRGEGGGGGESESRAHFRPSLPLTSDSFSP